MLRLEKVRVCVSVSSLNSNELFRFDGWRVCYVTGSNYRFRIVLYCAVLFTVNVSVPKELPLNKFDSHVLGFNSRSPKILV